MTESTILADPFRVRHVIDRLNELGLGFAIDDFGTGYSSLAYLKQLPVQTIKIDRSFVMDMLESESDAAIVRSTIDLARNLGLRVVAEGVETEAMWDALREQGCTLAQGYLISKPVSAAELAPLLVRRRGGVERLPVRRLAELGQPLVRTRGREARRVGLDPDARQVEPVGVPAGADGRVGGDEPVRVLEAGVAERLELRRRRPEQPLGVQLDRERRRARPVLGVAPSRSRASSRAGARRGRSRTCRPRRAAPRARARSRRRCASAARRGCGSRCRCSARGQRSGEGRACAESTGIVRF